MFLVLEARISSFYWTELLELNQEKIREHPWSFWENIFRRILNFRNFEILETLAFHFLNFLNFKIWIFDNKKWWILENDEKSKTRNLLTSNLPAEFWQTLGYEFHFFQKTWIHFRRERTNFSIFGRGNPYHQSTYRFPPLHPISAPDAMFRKTSEFNKINVRNSPTLNTTPGTC